VRRDWFISFQPLDVLPNASRPTHGLSKHLCDVFVLQPRVHHRHAGQSLSADPALFQQSHGPAGLLGIKPKLFSYPEDWLSVD
jgi:hypothetical protein